MVMRTRDAGFGDEPKRRIMIGTYALSSGYYEAYYGTAQKVRTVIKREHEAVFENFDLIVSPTSPTVAFALGAKIDDPLAMYLNDVLTIPSCMAGLPGLNIPCGLSDGLPVGLQLIGPSSRRTPCSRRATPRAGDRLRRRPGEAQMTAPTSWEAVIGLEIHVQLKTETKMFCRCRNGFGGGPEHTDVPGVPGIPGCAAGAEPARDRGDDQARAGARLHDRGTGGLPPQELLLPRPAEGVPDQPVRRTALLERQARCPDRGRRRS